MKIRTGFVSNSSSSSFCILGIRVDEYIDMDKFIYEHGDVDLYDWLWDAVHNGCNILNVERGLDNYGEEALFVGADPSQMRDDETMGEFKKKIAEDLMTFIGIKLKNVKEIHWYRDQGHD